MGATRRRTSKRITISKSASHHNPHQLLPPNSFIIVNASAITLFTFLSLLPFIGARLTIRLFTPRCDPFALKPRANFRRFTSSTNSHQDYFRLRLRMIKSSRFTAQKHTTTSFRSACWHTQRNKCQRHSFSKSMSAPPRAFTHRLWRHQM